MRMSWNKKIDIFTSQSINNVFRIFARITTNVSKKNIKSLDAKDQNFWKHCSKRVPVYVSIHSTYGFYFRKFIVDFNRANIASVPDFVASRKKLSVPVIPVRMSIWYKSYLFYFEDFLLAQTGSLDARVFVGFEDFFIAGEFATSQLIAPQCKQREKFIKGLRNGSASRENPSARITPINEKFLHHLEYNVNKTKFMPAHKILMTKRNKKAKRNRHQMHFTLFPYIHMYVYLFLIYHQYW